MAQPAAARVPGSLPQAVLLAGAVGLSVLLRASLAGPAGATSVRATLAFTIALGLIAFRAGTTVRISLTGLAVGLAGAAALVAPVAAHAAITGWPETEPAGNFFWWAGLTTLVASAEEAALRGALFDRLSQWRGPNVAVSGSAIAFAAIHLPFYGLHAMPLDFAVGVLLGAIRLSTGTWTSSAIAHTVADLAGWWLL